MGGSFGRDEGGRIAQLPGMRADPFRSVIPASAFRMEEHSPTGGVLPGLRPCLAKHECMPPQMLTSLIS